MNKLLCFALLITSCVAVKTNKNSSKKNDIVITGKIQHKVMMEEDLFKWYANGVNNYVVNDSLVGLIRPYSTKTGVLVFAGNWCSDTKELLPKVVKVLIAAGFKPEEFEFQLLDKQKKSTNFNAKAMQVNYVPTIIFYINGLEKGRIIETINKTAEEEILKILINF